MMPQQKKPLTISSIPQAFEIGKTYQVIKDHPCGAAALVSPMTFKIIEVALNGAFGFVEATKHFPDYVLNAGALRDGSVKLLETSNAESALKQ